MAPVIATNFRLPLTVLKPYCLANDLIAGRFRHIFIVTQNSGARALLFLLSVHVRLMLYIRKAKSTLSYVARQYRII